MFRCGTPIMRRSLTLAQTAKRQQMAEAAERRLKEQEHRGIKDPEKFRRQQQKRDELEQIAATAPGEANLRWQVR
uniref:Small VCP/p97-interacting protein n=1 Tax=Rhipicephalus microplus TaxID=6941 RepID=A0A6M2CL82_RHIMP